MPPRIPVVALFLACYFSAVLGGGFEAINRYIDLWNADIARAALGLFGLTPPTGVAPAGDLFAQAEARVWSGRLWLSIGDALVLGAAILALPDAAWRPARRGIDALLSFATAGAALAAMALEPGYITPSFSVLAALAAGDAAAALGAVFNRAAPPKA